MILTPTSGFIKQAGFTHSLSPARNCTFGCTYCYVPTMRIQGGLQREDWERWGQFTTFKPDASKRVSKELRPDQIIYCSPLTDPYQPAEKGAAVMPAILEALIRNPPQILTIQTRGPLILRDLPALIRLAERTKLRVSFSVTTNSEDVRKLYEPHCAPFMERLRVISELRAAGIIVFATLAPILPCDPELLAEALVAATQNDIIGDGLHHRSTKQRGATTRDAAFKISDHHEYSQWHLPVFQAEISERLKHRVEALGKRFGTGYSAFAWLAQ